MTVVGVFWNRAERRLRAVWRLLIQYVFFFTVTGIGSVAVGVLTAVVGALSGQIDMRGDPFELSQSLTRLMLESPLVNLALVFLSFLALVFTFWLGARWLDRRKTADYGLHFSPLWWRDLLFGLFLGALLMALIFAAELTLGWVTVAGFFRAGGSIPFFPAILLPVVLYLLVGMYEEMMFRGYMLKNLAEGLNLPRFSPRVALLLAYLISSSVFGLMHALNPNASLISTVNIILAGLFLGLGYILSGELALPIGLHITWNFFQGSVFGFPVSGTNAGASLIDSVQGGPAFWTGAAFGPEAGLVGVFAMLLGALLIILWVRWTRGQARLKDDLAVYHPRVSSIVIHVTN